MGSSEFGQFKDAEYENRCYTGILGSHQPRFHI